MKASQLKYLVLLGSCGLSACSSMNWFGEQPPSRPVSQQAMYGSSGQVVKQNEAVATSQMRPAAPDAVGYAPTQLASANRSGAAVGGSISRAMDSIDRSKLSHALDNPIGKASSWSNDNSGVKYTVIPVEKTTVNGNSYCRRYKATAEKGDQTREMSGVACVGAEGSWESV